MAFLIFQTFVPCWSLGTLDHTYFQLQKRVGQLRPATNPECKPGVHCIVCGAFMKTPTLVVCDAGQAYEVLNTSHIRQANNYVFGCALASKSPRAVFVMHGNKAVPGFGGSIYQKSRDRTILAVRSIQRAIVGFMGMRLFRLGNIFLCQRQGIPIGAPFSGAILENTLSYQEFKYDIAHPSRYRHIATGRFVDDLAALSRDTCYRCVTKVISSTYTPVVKLDYSDKHSTVCDTIIHEFLEGEIHFSFSAFSFYAKHRNMTYAITGDSKSIVKRSCPPMLGHFNRSVECRLRAELRGRIHRWQTMNINTPNFLVLVAVDMLFYLREGYSLLQLRSIWFRLPLYPVQESSVRHRFALVSRACKHLEWNDLVTETRSRQDLQQAVHSIARITGPPLPWQHGEAGEACEGQLLE